MISPKEVRALNTPPPEEAASRFWFNFRLYIIYVGYMKLMWGATFWEAAALFFDAHVTEGPITQGDYFKRCLLVGFFDAFFCCLAALGATYIEERKIDKNDMIGTAQLWGACVFCGGLWQVQTDFACWIASGEGIDYAFNSPIFSAKEIIANIFVFGVLQTFAFYISTRGLGAAWAEFTIDFQVGIGGFGFYLAGYAGITNPVWNSLWAGFCTATAGAIAAIPFMIYDYLYPSMPVPEESMLYKGLMDDKPGEPESIVMGLNNQRSEQ